MNDKNLEITNLAIEISSKLLNAACQLSTVKTASDAVTLWQKENSTLDQLLTDLTEFNEGFKSKLECLCGQELKFSDIEEVDTE